MNNKIEKSISVVIPMYNSRESILRALRSVNSQSVKDNIIEIIVVNDGSSDESEEIVKSYKAQSLIPIKLISQNNSGVSSARNRGMQESIGMWIAFLDSDDEWLPNKIEIQSKIIFENSNIDFLSSNMDENKTSILWTVKYELFPVTVKDLCFKMLSQPSTIIMKRKIYEEMGGFDETQRYAEDGNYCLKVSAKYNYYHIPIQVINYGSGKRGFGESGLSANMKAMYLGNIKNLNDILHMKLISHKFYVFMRFYQLLKYARRLMINRLNKRN